MTTFDKLSVAVGLQLLLVASLVGSFWITAGLAGYKGKIPKDLLREHQNRLGFIPAIPIIAYVVISLLSHFIGKPHWLSVVLGFCVVMIGICFLLRAILTLLSGRVVMPIRLKCLAWFELIMALAVMATSAIYW